MFNKEQIIVIFVVSSLTVFLFLLPTTLVSDKQLDNATQNVSNSQSFSHPKTNNGIINQQTDSLKQLITNNPSQSYEPYLDLARIFEREKKYDSAALYMEKLYTLKPNSTHLLRTANLYFQAFNFAIDENRLHTFQEKAQKYLKKILQEDATYLNEKVKLGLTYIPSSTPMQGIMLIREVLTQAPDNLLALNSMGVLALQSNQLEKAVNYFTKYIALDSSDINIYYYLANTYKSLKNNDLAKEYFIKIKQKIKDKERIDQIDKMLAELE